MINSLDAKGLYAEGPGGSASDPDILDTHNASLNAHNTIQRGARLFEQTAAMALLAEGTGGRFFQNNNNLLRGFRDLASAARGLVSAGIRSEQREAGREISQFEGGSGREGRTTTSRPAADTFL